MAPDWGCYRLQVHYMRLEHIINISIFYEGSRSRPVAQWMTLQWVVLHSEALIIIIHESTIVWTNAVSSIKSKCLWPMTGAAVYIHRYGSFSLPSTEHSSSSQSMCDFQESEVSGFIRKLSVQAPPKPLVINPTICVDLKRKHNLPSKPVSNKQPLEQNGKGKK